MSDHRALDLANLLHDDGLAVAALEQVCDRRGLFASCTRIPTTRWWVSLKDSGGKEISVGYDKSLALAICKALAELEKEN